MIDKGGAPKSRLVRTLRLDSFLAIEIFKPPTEEEAELIRVHGGFNDEAERAPREPGKP